MLLKLSRAQQHECAAATRTLRADPSANAVQTNTPRASDGTAELDLIKATTDTLAAAFSDGCTVSARGCGVDTPLSDTKPAQFAAHLPGNDPGNHPGNGAGDGGDEKRVAGASPAKPAEDGDLPGCVALPRVPAGSGFGSLLSSPLTKSRARRNTKVLHLL